MTRRSIGKRVAVVTAAALVAVGTFAAGGAVAGSEKAAKPTEKQVAALFDEWNAALKTQDPEKVADLYWDDAVLLPTLSNQVRADRESRIDYFEHFLANKPVGKKIETHINVLDSNSVLDAGLYEFALTDHDTGKKSIAKARYTYEWEKRDGEWKIVNHHSSLMPEG
ncbi:MULTISPECIES: SgcJ/EcaC family oxidoreductase [unclassified Streptomyces]|uniref:SgcJ/EcaC family oxidoreductase n=1 Tax=unclassified Streptomyces TaxID=2593676 RepID=UPI002365107F|nr:MULTISPECIES: SgcJ/EcaC family oxidoreductase [unclassified Streptomyces]MDF3141446.1 SgcJ/EcaC family oxidoreductase [Streptomyces sp. T21Q-yed]WDF40099.1 SgcJ/EcaC family oxidoreductase [Streptomyces sp. T12]